MLEDKLLSLDQLKAEVETIEIEKMISEIERSGLLLQKTLTVSNEVYHFFLRLFPRQFAQEYRDLIALQFEEQCRDAYAERGRWGLVGMWWRTLGDLGKGVVVERLRAGGRKREKVEGENQKLGEASNVRLSIRLIRLFLFFLFLIFFFGNSISSIFIGLMIILFLLFLSSSLISPPKEN